MDKILTILFNALRPAIDAFILFYHLDDINRNHSLLRKIIWRLNLFARYLLSGSLLLLLLTMIFIIFDILTQ